VLAALALGAVILPPLGPVGAQDRAQWVHQRFLEIDGFDGTRQRVVITYPRREDGRSHPPGERYPVVIALHGRGESQLAPNRGALAWYLQYDLPEAFGALARGRLTPSDYKMLVRQPHLEMVNRSLASRPFRGVMVVSPFTPDLMGDPPDGERVQSYLDWLAGPLLVALRQQMPFAARGRDSTGIDGVSLGGMLALEAGFAHPETFGAVGAIQPAIRGRTGRILAAAEQARDSGNAQQIRLLTSDGDPFKAPTQQLSRSLRAAQLSHRLIVVPGPHDYVFNQGPGAIELLRYFDEVLAREPLR
jgi:enterochelin esterase-like enzyme